MCQRQNYNASEVFYSRNPDKEIYLESYTEEYDGLTSNNMFDIISEDEYFQLCKSRGIKAIPSMCTITLVWIKKWGDTSRPLYLRRSWLISLVMLSGTYV
jgi:hypothetical protein